MIWYLFCHTPPKIHYQNFNYSSKNGNTVVKPSSSGYAIKSLALQMLDENGMDSLLDNSSSCCDSVLQYCFFCCNAMGHND